MGTLEELQNELILSAQFGQQLLEENARLKLEIGHLSALRSPSAADNTNTADDTISAALALSAARAPALTAAATEAHILRIEKQAGDLQTRLESCEEQLKAAEIARDKAERRRVEAVEQARRDADFAARRIEQLEEECGQFRAERADQSKKERDNKRADSDEVNELRKRVEDLEDVLVSVERERDACVREAGQHTEEIEALLARCRELEERCIEVDSLREGEAACFTRIFELEAVLVREKETVEELQAAVRRLGGDESGFAPTKPSPEDDGEADSNGKSLFSEVEDRRKEWESKHRDLSAKHAGLVRAHNMSIHQQERMRNHISRLSQLSIAKGDQERVRRLEAALAQRESENKELTAKITALEKGAGGGRLLVEIGGSQGGPKGVEALGPLRLRLQHLTAENEALRRENRTGRMMRLGETEKLRTTEKMLAHRDQELEMERAKLANIKFELDDLKLRIKAGIFEPTESQPSAPLPKDGGSDGENRTRRMDSRVSSAKQSHSRFSGLVKVPEDEADGWIGVKSDVAGASTQVADTPDLEEPSIELDYTQDDVNVELPVTPLRPSHSSNASPSSTMTSSPSFSESTTSSTSSPFSALLTSRLNETPSRQQSQQSPQSPDSIMLSTSPVHNSIGKSSYSELPSPAAARSAFARTGRSLLEKADSPKKVYVNSSKTEKEECRTQ
ncbi:hypothetical protein M427DRAFT_153487 [Gonapodya prolifera JEL478]|uniref:Uncharacterized protein n=1 Tax=Gonapodya prolifera (strain JEL478) TaxID=1344416 RepID=A0A139AMD9_GONPJ|nr:hypothetical protein M427DRAFT_153487 [Gonapodya prolifera JEL478]|eukprot:KXS17932.1 hypothetical protein M427DRAFT_153487 [Gonapodya prolifera JEL478]